MSMLGAPTCFITFSSVNAIHVQFKLQLNMRSIYNYTTSSSRLIIVMIPGQTVLGLTAAQRKATAAKYKKAAMEIGI